MGHGGTVNDELMTDHREVEELFGRVEALPPANELPAPGAGLVDRARDALTGRGRAS